MIPQGVEIFVALEPVDMRLGFERLGGIVREKMHREPRTRRALFVFFGKRKTSLEVIWWDGTGAILLHKKLDHGVFDRPMPTSEGDLSHLISEAAFQAIFVGVRPTLH